MNLTSQDVLEAWSNGQASLRKGSVSSPGLPVAPRPRNKRAPRPANAFWDPVEQANHPSAPESVQPITLGDLQRMEQQSSYDKVQQRSTRVKSAVKSPVASVRLHQISQKIARLEMKRPVHNLPSHFMPS